ncbi:MAG: GIY-YIG nuclease family protein [Planctomycetota bacterium]
MHAPSAQDAPVTQRQADSPPPAQWWLYVVRCGDDSLYAGISTDVARRVREHAAGGTRSARYLRGRGPVRLVRRWRVGAHGAALRAEWRFKRLPKAVKERFIARRGGPLPAALR